MDEELRNRRERLRFRSWHRGTREMDLILGSFADRHVGTFSAEDLDLYENLLGENDPDLYNWYAGRELIPETRRDRIMDLFLSHRFATG